MRRRPQRRSVRAGLHAQKALQALAAGGVFQGHAGTGQPFGGAEGRERGHEKAALRQGFYAIHALTQVPGRREGGDPGAQALHQLMAAADADGRNVVDGLVAVQLGTLAAREGQGANTCARRPSWMTWNRPAGPAPITTASAAAGDEGFLEVACTAGLQAWVGAPDP